MNSKRSMWTLVFAALGACVSVTNCTVQSDDTCTAGKKKSGCECPGNAVGSQTCLDDGTYGACDCPGVNQAGSANGGGAGASNAGAANGGASYAGTAGYTSNAGAAAVEAGAGGEAGQGGLVIDPTDCYSCLTQLCAAEWDACAMDNEDTVANAGDAYCLSKSTTADPGQIELIVDCITTERAKGLVKRDAVRACGSTIGMSADPQFFVWAPADMTPATEQLVNCMADAPDETMPGTWATDANNFPASGPRPWDDGTCAKLACTSDESNLP